MVTATLPLAPEPIPIVVDAHGVARVAGTRVALESVVSSYQQGNSPEVIAEQYDSVALSDIYAVIFYYLRHRSEVDAYILQTEALGESLRHQSLTEPRIAELRERLVARQLSCTSKLG